MLKETAKKNPRAKSPTLQATVGILKFFKTQLEIELVCVVWKCFQEKVSS